MSDHVSPKKRSEIMAAVKSKNTKPESIIRSLLHTGGFRYRLHDKNLPGKPDIVLKKYRAVILVNGCFWHGHGCKRSKNLPKTRTDFWKEKIDRNRERDKKNLKLLKAMKWRICIVWECALKRQGLEKQQKVALRIIKWLDSKSNYLEIKDVNSKGVKNGAIQ